MNGDKKRNSSVLLICLLLFLLISRCGQEKAPFAKGTKQVKDATGAVITIPKKPQHI